MPQNPHTRRKEKAQRAKKLAEWRARQQTQGQDPTKPKPKQRPKKASES